MTKSHVQHYDIVISGGGLSGTLMALGLSKCRNSDGHPLSIAIIETNVVEQTQSITFDDRVLALSHSSVDYLKSQGIWSKLLDVAEPIAKIHVSDRGYYGKARLNAEDHQVDAMGYVVDMKLLGNAIYQTLINATQGTNVKREGNERQVTWFSPDAIDAIVWQSQHVELALTSGEQMTCSLLIGCDGAQSICRKQANIGVSQRQYCQSALIANVTTRKPHNNIAYERFTEYGPIAMLPLADLGQQTNRCSLVWTLPPEMAAEMANLNEDAFNIALEKAFGSWLGAITHSGRRSVFPLTLVQAEEQVYHRMVLIGNASHTIHPIAGQGFNLGLRDVQQFVALVAEQLLSNADIGQLRGLSDYAARRKHDHQQVIELTDSLVTLFSNELPPLSLGRTVGLKVLNYVSPIKNAFAKKTMGY